MNFNVRNENICVGEIRVLTVGSSSILKVGDTQAIQLFSVFDAILTDDHLGTEATPGGFPLHFVGSGSPGPIQVAGAVVPYHSGEAPARVPR